MKKVDKTLKKGRDARLDEDLNAMYATPVTMRGCVNSLHTEDKVILAKHTIPRVFADELSDWLHDQGTRQMFRDEFYRQEGLYTQHNIGTPEERKLAVERFGAFDVPSNIYRLVCSLHLPGIQHLPALSHCATILDDPSFQHFFDNLILTFYEVPINQRETGHVFIDDTLVPDRIKKLLLIKMLIDHTATETDFFTQNRHGERPKIKTCIDLYIDRHQGSRDKYHEDSSKNERSRTIYVDNVDYLTLAFLAGPGERDRLFKGTSVVPAHKYEESCMAVTSESHTVNEICLGMLHGGNLSMDDTSCFHSTPPTDVQENPREIDTYAEINRDMDRSRPETFYPHLVFDRDSVNETFGTDDNPTIVSTVPPKIASQPLHLQRLRERLYRNSARTFIRCHHVNMVNSRVAVDQYKYVAENIKSMVDVFTCTAASAVANTATDPDLQLLFDWSANRHTGENVVTVNSPSEMNEKNKDIMENSDQGIGKNTKRKKSKSKSMSKRRGMSKSKSIRKGVNNFVMFCKKKNIKRFKNKLRIKIFIP